MQTLDRALKGWQGKGRPIQIPFPGVAKIVDFRTGDLAVLAGAPGGGKSTVGLNWAWASKDPTLYLAQDSPRSVLKRLTALALTEKVADIHEEEAEYWGEKVAKLGKRDELVIATGAHTVDMIEKKIVALTEWLMEPPPILFIDNLFDLQVEGASYMETGFYADVLPKLKQVAIKHDVGMVILHHVTRSSGDGGSKHGMGESRLRMTDLLFAGEREARHVWAVYRGWDNKRINFQILKQQDGRADPSGGLSIPLDWDAEGGKLWR